MRRTGHVGPRAREMTELEKKTKQKTRPHSPCLIVRLWAALVFNNFMLFRLPQAPPGPGNEGGPASFLTGVTEAPNGAFARSLLATCCYNGIVKPSQLLDLVLREQAPKTTRLVDPISSWCDFTFRP